MDGPGTTKATPGDASLAGRSPDDYYACHAPPGGLGLAFASVARQLTRNEWAFVVGRVNPTSALHGTVAEGDKLVAVNGSAVGLLPLADPQRLKGDGEVSRYCMLFQSLEAQPHLLQLCHC